MFGMKLTAEVRDRLDKTTGYVHNLSETTVVGSVPLPQYVQSNLASAYKDVAEIKQVLNVLYFICVSLGHMQFQDDIAS